MKHRKASAILLSFFMMSMLILVSLGVSFLVLRDLSTMRTVLGGVQATYAAEGMTELGLQLVKENLPGYEVRMNNDEFMEEYFDLTLPQLELQARSNAIPCAEQTNEEWMRLSQNESLQVPLFVQESEDGSVITPTENFKVDYYVGYEDGTGLRQSAEVDVLRWKVLGFRRGSTVTEAMSEFIPLQQETNSSAETPTSFGTFGTTNHQYSYGKYSSNGFFSGNYSIAQFLDGHEYNYLVLTNVIDHEDLYLYFRIQTQGEETLACPYVQVDGMATNEFGEARQSLQTFMKEGENLPAYDFVLYNTDGESEEEEENSGFIQREWSF